VKRINGNPGRKQRSGPAVRQLLIDRLTGYLVIMMMLGFGLRRLCRPKADDWHERSLTAERPRGPCAAAGSRRG